LPPAATLLLALLEREGSGRTIGDPATAEPGYGRPAEAQARWEARHGRPLPDSPRPAGWRRRRRRDRTSRVPRSLVGECLRRVRRVARTVPRGRAAGRCGRARGLP